MKHFTLQLVRYTAVGLCATATQYLILILLVELFHMQAVFASSIGCIFGSIVSYFMNHRYTFQSEKRHRDALWRFYSITAIGTSLNALFMYVGVNEWHIQYIVAQVITTGLILIWNFLGNRHWTFKH
ncbi:MAG: GtrA family protein [Gammaproteobacteria bacterium]|nr:GtrA family protein [Gammaproteobacteria bacterium]